jgi:hypothetical protein
MAAFPTLSRGPSYPLDPDGVNTDVVLRNETTGGYEITRPRTTRSRLSWGVNFNGLTDSDISTLKTFEVTTLKNGSDSFTWQHPVSGTNYTVRLTGPISYSKFDKDITAVSFGIKQV